MLDRLDETIVALSSAPGRSVVGIVRMSGSRAFEILQQITQTPLDGLAPARIRGEMLIDGARIPSVFHLFRGPKSYTRQDVVEILTVGSPPLLELVRARLISRGAVAAVAGEFTARAYFNGALDLQQAEGVARLINAQSDTQLRAARRMMEGHWSERILALRDELAELLGLVEAGIDFAEEPIEFISDADLIRRLGDLRRVLATIQSSGVGPEVFNPLPRILLLGPPNAGKSSLMNRLSGMSRAICSAIAGTTRDILSAPVALAGTDAILLDAAGVDDSPDEIIAQARELVFAAAGTVDLVCLVLDANVVPSEATSFLDSAGMDSGIIPGLVILNKSDLLEASIMRDLIAGLRQRMDVPIVAVSALRGYGIEELRSELSRALQSCDTTVMGEAASFSARQKDSLVTAEDSIQRAIELVENVQVRSSDLLAFELREALEGLAAVTGEVTTEDLLSQIFANFCIGK